MRSTLTLLLLLTPAIVFSQQYFDKTKSEVKKELEKYVQENKAISPSLTETDGTLVLAVNDPAAQPASFIYGFDETTGLCNYQRTIAQCDSCYKKYLSSLLEQKGYNWKKINENQYVSKFSDGLMLEIPPDEGKFYFTLFKTKWTKDIYDILLQK